MPVPPSGYQSTQNWAKKQDTKRANALFSRMGHTLSHVKLLSQGTSIIFPALQNRNGKAGDFYGRRFPFFSF